MQQKMQQNMLCTGSTHPQCLVFSTITYSSPPLLLSLSFSLSSNFLYTSQNENVHRAYTSMHRVADLRRPDRRTAMKVLVEKT